MLVGSWDLLGQATIPIIGVLSNEYYTYHKVTYLES